MRRNPGQSLRFVRTLALVSALPGCVVNDGEVVQPPPNGGSSGGATVVQGNGVVQGNNGGEDNVEMRTVLVGNQQPAPAECMLGQVVQRGPNLQCRCAVGNAGLRWQCYEVVAARCVVGDDRSDPRLSCTCVNTARGPDWSCVSNERHMVGPLPPPELEVFA